MGTTRETARRKPRIAPEYQRQAPQIKMTPGEKAAADLIAMEAEETTPEQNPEAKRSKCRNEICTRRIPSPCVLLTICLHLKLLELMIMLPTPL